MSRRFLTERRREKKCHGEGGLPLLFSLLWILSNISSSLSVMISATYWSLIYNPEQDNLDFKNFSGHLFLPIIHIVDLSVSDRWAEIWKEWNSLSTWIHVFEGTIVRELLLSLIIWYRILNLSNFLIKWCSVWNLSCRPWKFKHTLHPLAYSIAYALFTLIYFIMGGTNENNEP